jgi:deoxycytidylate deaminase
VFHVDSPSCTIYFEEEPFPTCEYKILARNIKVNRIAKKPLSFLREVLSTWFF